MIVRIKTVADTEILKKARERIKEQMREGLIVHDDTIEITFIDDKNIKKEQTCQNCGCRNLIDAEVDDLLNKKKQMGKRCSNCNYLMVTK